MPTCRLEVHESALQMTEGNIAGLEAVLNLHPDPRVSLCMTVILSLVCRAQAKSDVWLCLVLQGMRQGYKHVALLMRSCALNPGVCHCKHIVSLTLLSGETLGIALQV